MTVNGSVIPSWAATAHIHAVIPQFRSRSGYGWGEFWERGMIFC